MIRFDPPITRKEWLIAIAVAIPAGFLGNLAGVAIWP